MNHTDEELHVYAREIAASLKEPDKKQLRFNDIVRVAKEFYRNDVTDGVKELVKACDKANEDLYEKGNPMWKSLDENYRWMIA